MEFNELTANEQEMVDMTVTENSESIIENTQISVEVDYSKPFENVGEALTFGLSKSIFAFAIVFAVLATLWLFLATMSRFFNKSPKDKKQKTKKVKSENEVTQEKIVVFNAPSQSNDSEIVAAIVSAITSYRESLGVNGGFRVVSFKKRK